MREKPITIVEWERVPTLVARPDRFTFSPKRGWMPVQRLCFWLLGKIGAIVVDEVDEMKSHVFYADSFMTALLKQEHVAYEISGKRPDKVYVGAEDFAEFIHSEAPHHPFGFDARYFTGPDLAIRGLRVVVVPWLRGIFIPPRGE